MGQKTRNGSKRSGAAGRNSANRAPARRAPLQDNYYYEEPPRPSRREREAYYNEQERYYPPVEQRTKRSRGPQPEPPRRKHRLRTALITLVCLLLVLGVGLFAAGSYFLTGLTVKSVDESKLGVLSGVQSSGSVKNIALFGLDTREDVNEGRSDALMVLTVDNKHGKLKLTSILRDSEVTIEGYGKDKITHAYAYGGAELAIHTLNQNFKLDITDYITVNFMEMARIVDAFGGSWVTITAEEAQEINANLGDFTGNGLTDSDYLSTEGELLLNGRQAVAYSRIRSLDSDDMRASRQQNVLMGLVKQLKNTSKLKYPFLIRNIVPLCETSLGGGDIMSMLPIVFSGMNVETLTIPGEEEAAEGGYTDEGLWVYQYDLETASRHLNQFIYEEAAQY